jgi:hypothetical protein
VQQQLAPTTVLEIAYVGSISRHLLGELDTNMPTLAARESNPDAPVNNIRPYLGYSDFHTRVPAFTANYNSLQVSLNHRSRDLTLGIAYTWSKNLTDQANDRGGTAQINTTTSLNTTTYTYDPKLDYGPSSLNEPQLFIANFVYKLPFLREQHGLLGHIAGGWEISGITTFISGLSTSLTQSVDPLACVTDATTASGCAPGTYPGGLGLVTPNADISPRPDQVAPVHLLKKQTEWFDPTSFIQAQGHFGTEGVGNILSPGEEKVDLGLMKNIRFTEHANLQLRAESFNVFNHTNFETIGTGLSTSTFGQVTAAHEARRMQFSGKLYF